MKKNLISFFLVIAIIGLMAARVYGGSITVNTLSENNLANSDLSIDVSSTIDGLTYVSSDFIFSFLTDPKIELEFSAGTLSIGTPANLQLCQGGTLIASYTSGDGEDTIILTSPGGTRLDNNLSYTFHEDTGPDCQSISANFLTLDVPSGNTSVQLTINSSSSVVPGVALDTASAKLVSIDTCDYGISSTSQTFDSSGGTGSVSVTISDTACSLAASTNENWIQVTHILGEGTLEGTINYTVSENASTSSRTGTISISGTTLTVTQESSCTYTLSSTSATIESSGSTDSVSVTASSTECSWTATSSDTWITIDSGSSESGDGTVSYTVSENTTTSTRTGTMTIAQNTFTITQSGISCAYSISPTSQSFDSAGGTDSVSVTATSIECGWTATSSDTWITITTNDSGVGDGTVSYSVSANTSTDLRTGTITIADQTHTVNQAGVEASPIPDIKANGSDGPITIGTNDTLSIDISLSAGDSLGTDADWWLVVNTPTGGLEYFDLTSGAYTSGLLVTYMGPLFNFGSTVILNTSGLGAGTYTYYFVVDSIMNGTLDTGTGQLYFDSVVVNITP